MLEAQWHVIFCARETNAFGLDLISYNKNIEISICLEAHGYEYKALTLKLKTLEIINASPADDSNV